MKIVGRKVFTFLSWAMLALVLVSGVFIYYNQMSFNAHGLKIGATYMTMNNDFYQVLNQEIEKEVVKNNDRLFTRNPALDVDKQIEEIEYFIANSMDIIIINPVDATAQSLADALKKAKEAGIKVVVVDSQMTDQTAMDATVVSDNYQAGVLNAQHLMRTKKSAKILLLEHANAMSAVDRIQGFLDTIEGHDAYQVIDRRDCLGQTELAMPEVKASFEAGNQFDTVIALNDKAAIGALAAIEEMAYLDPVSIYGVDGSPDMKNLLSLQNELEATVAQSPLRLAQLAIQTGYKLYDGETVATELRVPVSLITTENLKDYSVTGWQ